MKFEVKTCYTTKSDAQRKKKSNTTQERQVCQKLFPSITYEAGFDILRSCRKRLNVTDVEETVTQFHECYSNVNVSETPIFWTYAGLHSYLHASLLSFISD